MANSNEIIRSPVFVIWLIKRAVFGDTQIFSSQIFGGICSQNDRNKTPVIFTNFTDVPG